tara:strand:- start:514 stop:624 length:111 start_codon:yes stop_codon:yes gene_type:complete
MFLMAVFRKQDSEIYAFFSIPIVNGKWKRKGWIRED